MSANSATPVGIDFGTSNSAVAVAHDAEDVEWVEFSLLGSQTHSYRSLLFFDPDEQQVGQPIDYCAGVEAVEAYLESMGEGRLIQSFKTHLTTESLGRTQIGPHLLGLDQMLTLFFVRLKQHAERQLGVDIRRAILGRPVNFWGAKTEEMNIQAQTRLQEAAHRAGFEQLGFEFEPIAAAYHYECSLSRPELVLVADFGGGTTDFCLMRLTPDRGEQRSSDSDIVATGGVGVAGDDLDAAIIDHVVSPRLGKGSTYREMGKELTIPSSYFFKLSRWHHLSFLKGKRTQAELHRLHRQATDPDAIAALLHVIENNQGFHLHKAVERLKISLSNHSRGSLLYSDGPVRIECDVERRQFEEWIAPCVAAIAQGVDDTLARAQVAPAAVERVFLTGGTAFVPAVRREFKARFGGEALRGGDELMSIASGLALHAMRLWGSDTAR